MSHSKPDDAAVPALGKPLEAAFFERSVHEIAPDLIGATLLFNGVGGRIVEVEAYHHTDPAAHAHRGPRPRTTVMFGPPGFAYIYRCHGKRGQAHSCVSFVCEKEGSASTVLMRALEPTHGIAEMRRRRSLQDDRALCSGPGKLTEALGITHAHYGLRLDMPPFALHARSSEVDVVAGRRIGISKAVDLPWRYGLKGSKFLSRPFKSPRLRERHYPFFLAHTGRSYLFASAPIWGSRALCF